MSTVVYGYPYTDGSSFNTAGHSNNLYSGSGGEGIHSERNGRLTYENFGGSLSFRAGDILPGEVHRVYSQHGLHGLAYVSNAIPDSSGDTFTSVFQAGLKFRLPREARAIEWNWQVYLHQFRVRSEKFDEDSRLDFEVEVAAEIDEAVVPCTRRQLAGSIFSMFDSAGGFHIAGLAYIANNEAITAQCYHGTHITTNVSTEYTSFAFKVRLAQTNFPPNRMLISRHGSAYTERYHDVYNRVTLGIRNCHALVHF